MSWKQKQIHTATDEIHKAAEEGVGTALMFTHEWVAAHQPVAGEGPSRQEGDSIPDMTLNYTEVSS